MSRWMEATDVDVDGDELNILCGQDFDGSIYVTVKIKDVFAALVTNLTEKEK